MNYFTMLKRALLNFFKGRRYFGHYQKEGRVFVPGEIRGYFNDFIHKTEWKGELKDGIPIMDFGNKRTYFMINVLQKALGHWDRYLLYKSEKDKKEFIKLCEFSLNVQDEKGGFKIWDDIGVSEFFISPYSSICQGHAISCFLRAYIMTGREKFLNAGRKALDVLFLDIKKGGVLRRLNGSIIILEEYPEEKLNGVLNGWIYAIYGIYEYWIFEKVREVYNFLLENLNSLKRLLPLYDSGFWSFYNLKKEIAPLFYHELHIELLNTFYKIFEEDIFLNFSKKFMSYKKRKLNFIRARIKRIYQFFKNPPKFIPVI